MAHPTTRDWLCICAFPAQACQELNERAVQHVLRAAPQLVRHLTRVDRNPALWTPLHCVVDRMTSTASAADAHIAVIKTLSASMTDEDRQSALDKHTACSARSYFGKEFERTIQSGHEDPERQPRDGVPPCCWQGELQVDRSFGLRP